MATEEQIRRTKLLLRGPGLILSMVFLILISYCSVHRGWWMDLTISLTVGVVTSLATLIVMSTNLIYMHRSLAATTAGPPGRLFKKIPAYIVPVLTDILLLQAWIWTVFICVRNNKGKDESKALDPPPTALWALAVSCAVAECIICALAPIHTILEYRHSNNKGATVW